MEAIHVIGYSTLSIQTWHFIYSVKLLNAWGGKNRIGKKKSLAKKMQRKKICLFKMRFGSNFQFWCLLNFNHIKSMLLKHQQKHFLAVLCCQIVRSLIYNSRQTCGGQSINKCTVKEKENAETNRTWIKRKDSDLLEKIVD